MNSDDNHVLYSTIKYTTHTHTQNIGKTLACTLTHTQIHNGDTADAKTKKKKLGENIQQCCIEQNS